MSCKTYFRFMLVFPLFAVLFILGPNWIMVLRKNEFGTPVGLPLSLVSIPYCIFIASFITWTWKKADNFFMRAVRLSPLILVPFALISWAMLNYDSQEALSRNSALLDLAIIAIEVLVIGYLYILAATAICKLLKFVQLMK